MKYEYKIEFETEHSELVPRAIDLITQTLRQYLIMGITNVLPTFTILEDEE